ncbi:hypothetical protein BDZ88DRAFT_28571 [Geranomyces variabilis]|nr:hypothetical protein BDZ88DRAFT_28571 [Geranomyces variabilis]
MRLSVLTLLIATATAVAASPAPQFQLPPCPLYIVPPECIPGKTPCDYCNPNCLDCVLAVPFFPGGPAISVHVSFQLGPTPVPDSPPPRPMQTNGPIKTMTVVPIATATPVAGGAPPPMATGGPMPAATSKFWVDAATVSAATANPSAASPAPNVSSGLKRAPASGLAAGLLGILVAAAV